MVLASGADVPSLVPMVSKVKAAVKMAVADHVAKAVIPESTTSNRIQA